MIWGVDGDETRLILNYCVYLAQRRTKTTEYICFVERYGALLIRKHNIWIKKKPSHSTVNRTCTVAFASCLCVCECLRVTVSVNRIDVLVTGFIRNRFTWTDSRADGCWYLNQCINTLCTTENMPCMSMTVNNTGSKFFAELWTSLSMRVYGLRRSSRRTNGIHEYEKGRQR